MNLKKNKERKEIISDIGQESIGFPIWNHLE